MQKTSGSSWILVWIFFVWNCLEKIRMCFFYPTIQFQSVYFGGQWFNGFDHSKDVWPFCIQVVIVQTLGAKYDPFLGPCLVVNNLILGVPSGKHTKNYWKWPIEIVDLPINSMVIFNSYVKWPEGTQVWITEWKNHSSLSSGAIHPCFFWCIHPTGSFLKGISKLGFNTKMMKCGGFCMGYPPF